MDGVHDLGGVLGFGPVVVVADEPVFAEPWERRVFGLNFSSLPVNVDQFRFAVERMGALEYLTTGYYRHWLAAIEALAVETGAVTAEELEGARAAAAAGATPLRRLDPARAAGLVAAVQQPSRPDVDAAPGAFSVGSDVRVRRASPRGHTRCPRYARGAAGVVESVRGRFALPDAGAEGRRVLEPLYGVRFPASELWGEGDHVVHLDLWESYLEPAGGRGDEQGRSGDG